MKAIDLIREFAKARKTDGNRHSCGNVYYIGNVLYSYGAHFPLAVVEGSIAYVNTDKYSPTTSKQQTWTRGSLTGYTQVEVSTRQLQDIITEQREIVQNCRNGNCGKYQTVHSAECTM